MKLYNHIRKSFAKHLNRFLRHVVYAIFMTTCVEEEPPKGGEEDKNPPMLVEKLCNPNNTDKQTNFSGKKLVFVFDKDIKINNAYEEIKITPLIKETHSNKNLNKFKKHNKSDSTTNTKPENKIQSPKTYGYTYRPYGSKGIILRLKNTLNKNTVYVIHFGKAISSKYGGVTNENLSVTFTTGSKISDLSIRGKVVDIMNGAAIQNVYVALYKANRKQNVLNAAPDYFTKTDNEGNYEIKYIKEDKYLLMASNAINFEDTKELGVHTLGFLSKPININAKMDKDIKYKIHAVKRYLDPLKIEKNEVKDGTYIIAFNNPIKDYKISLKGDAKNYMVYSFLSDDKKEITVFNWFKNGAGETLQQLEENTAIPAKIIITDSENGILVKNIELNFGKDFAVLKGLKIKIDPDNNYIGRNGKIMISADIPFKKVDVGKAYFKDSKGNKLYFDNKDVSYDTMNNVIILKKKLFEDNDKKEEEAILPITLYTLILEKGFITTIDNKQSSSLNKKYILQTNKSTGTIHGTLNLGLANYKIRLLNKKFEVLQEIKKINFGSAEYMFKNVPAGEYTIAVIELNGKAEWFVGDMNTLTPPGAVYLYHDKNDFVRIGPGLKMKLKTMFPKLHSK